MTCSPVLRFIHLLLLPLRSSPVATFVCVQFKLLEFLKHRFEQKHRISVERVVSGPGIANVYVEGGGSGRTEVLA